MYVCVYVNLATSQMTIVFFGHAGVELYSYKDQGDVCNCTMARSPKGRIQYLRCACAAVPVHGQCGWSMDWSAGRRRGAVRQDVGWPWFRSSRTPDDRDR